MTNSIFLFQRSLRLEDNLGLIECLNNSDKVYPIFCVDPRQATKKNSFLRTERTYSSIYVYERYAFSFNPFQDSLSTVFSIMMVPRVPF